MAEPPMEPEDDLLRRLRAGDEAAFAGLYGTHQGRVYRFALRMSGSSAIAEDVVQEVFMALMRDGGAYDATRGPLSAYLIGIARNQVRRRLERDNAYVPLPEDREAGSLGDLRAADPLAEIARRERVQRVREAVLDLPLPYREVVVLCELDELDYEEAAKALGCPLGTVRSRLHRGRELLAVKLRAIDAAAVPRLRQAR